MRRSFGRYSHRFFSPGNLHFLSISRDSRITARISPRWLSPRPPPRPAGACCRPPTPSLDGGVHLTVHIEKIGLKNAIDYLDSFITVSVRDVDGRELESSQDTPTVNQKRDNNYIIFGCNVQIQTQVNRMPPGTAIVFEFKHFKPKGEYVSTKAWAFMDLDEIKPGPSVVEIYAKPMDPRRKKLKLLSVKPLYLHLNLKETAI